MKILKDLAVSGQITVGQLLQSSIDTDKFLVAENGVVKFRTGSEILSDIGGISGNQNITLSGDATGSGTTAITITLANTGVTAGAYNNVTVDAKGRVTAGSNVAYLTSLPSHNHDGRYIRLDTVNEQDGVVAYFRPVTSGGYTMMKFESKVNQGSDYGWILMQDDSANTNGAPTTEDVRMTIGVFNDFQGPGVHSDELWFQGGARLVQNVGSWDSEYNTIIGTPAAKTNGTTYEWRVNNSSVMAISFAGVLSVGGNTVWHAGNLTNLNQLTNGPGYITSYTETDTLASVTGRGSSTSTAVTFNSGITVSGTTYYTFNKPSTGSYQTVALFGSSAGGLFITSDNAIISKGAYYNNGWIATATAGSLIDLTANSNQPGIATFSGATVGQGVSFSATQIILHAGNYTSYSPSLTGSGASGTWGINISGNSATTSQTNFGSLTVNSNTVLHAGNWSSYAAPRAYVTDSFVEFLIYGDANTYYPVTIHNWNGSFSWQRYSIHRSYYDTAPWDPIGTGSHKGGLTFAFEWAGDIAWGGNDKSFRVIEFHENYTQMVAGMQLAHCEGIVVWLRGGGSGGAYYRLHGPGGRSQGYSINMSSWTSCAGVTYSPRSYSGSTVDSEINSKFPVRGYGNGDLYVNNNIVWHQGNLTNLSQLTNGPGYITSASLNSYLPLSGGTLSGNLYIQSGGNPSQLILKGTNSELYVDSTYGGGTSRIFINRQSASNQATLHFTTAATVTNGSAWASTGMPLWTMGMTNSSQTSDFKIAYGDIYDAVSVALRIDTNKIVYFTNTPYVGGNIMATQSWVTSQGYLTSGSYLPLSGGSLTGALRINANWGAGGYSERLTIYGTYPSYAFRSTTTDAVWLHHMQSDGALTWYYGAGATAENWSMKLKLDSSGDLWRQNSTQYVYNSGTWGISITGNADTVDGFHAVTAYGGADVRGKIIAAGSQGNISTQNPEAYSGEVRLGAAWDRGGVYASSTLSLGTSASQIHFVFSNSVPLYVNSSGSIVADGTIDFDGKSHYLGVSSGWDGVGFGNLTNLHFQGHPMFWIGAGNAYWWNGGVNTEHDLLITTMYGYDSTSYYRGITFAVDNNGNGNTGGYRLGRWQTYGSGWNTSRLQVDASLSVGYGNRKQGGAYDEAKYPLDRGVWAHGRDVTGYGDDRVRSRLFSPTANGGGPWGSFASLEVSSIYEGNNDIPALFRMHQWGSGSAELWKPQGTVLYLRESPGGGGSWFTRFEVQGSLTSNNLLFPNGFQITQGGSNYAQFNSWVYLPGHHGFYAGANGAHIYPNNGSYGAWRIAGSRSGWGGIEFDNGSAGNVTLMLANDSNTSGFHNNSYGWQIRWANGTLYVGKNSYGGNEATVIDSSSIGSQSVNYANYSGYADRIQTGNNQWIWSNGAHTATNPNTITLWDQYSSNGGSGYPTTYGTIMDIYGRSAHEHDQLYFGESGQFLHRNCFYGTNSWSGWRTILNSSNYNSYSPTLTGGGASGTWSISVTGRADGALKLWATSHPNDYYIVNNWTGSHWYLTSNHGSPVRVGYADSAGSASSASSATYITIPDWRDTTYSPNQYNGNSVVFHFNNVGQNSGPAGDYWGAMMTVSPWSVYNDSHRQSQIWFGGSSGLSYRYAVGSGYTPTGWSGWERIVTSANIGSFGLPYGNWGGSTGMNDQKLYFRTNGDNNHFLWNADDDWEELRFYTGTGFRLKGSNGTTYHTFSTDNATFNTQVYVNRHIDANTTWGSCGCTSLFLGWSTSKIIIGNNASGAHDWANDRGANSIVSTVNHYFYNNIYAREDVVAYWSDARLKDNVKPIEGALEKISKIGGYYYTPSQLAVDLNATSDMSERVGVMAQEIEEIMPHVVKPAPFNNDYKTVQYEKLVPLLIQGIKEQQTQIEELKKQINNK